MTLTITLDPPKLTRPKRVVKTLIASFITVVSQLLNPAKPVLANLAHIPLTLVGTGCIDFAAFHLAHGFGWLVTGLSLLVIEHLIADEKLCARGSVL